MLFCHFLNNATLKEIHLNGRLFTWTNERMHPILEKMDQTFISNEWEDLFPSNDLHSLSSRCSDHAPLLLRMESTFTARKRFHFRSLWPKCPIFMEVVQQAWHCPLRDANPIRRLDWLFQNTVRLPNSWSNHFIGNVRL
jgi:hypothetical protein